MEMGTHEEATKAQLLDSTGTCDWHSISQPLNISCSSPVLEYSLQKVGPEHSYSKTPLKGVTHYTGDAIGPGET